MQQKAMLSDNELNKKHIPMQEQSEGGFTLRDGHLRQLLSSSGRCSSSGQTRRCKSTRPSKHRIHRHRHTVDRPVSERRKENEYIGQYLT